MVSLCVNASDINCKQSTRREKVSRDLAREGCGVMLRSRVSHRVDGAGALCLPLLGDQRAQ